MQRTITIPANGTYPLRVTGSILVIISATAPFDVDTDRDGRRSMATDRKMGSPGGRQFHRLIFYDTSGADNSITFYVGDQDYTPNTVVNTGITSIRNAPTYTKGQAIATLASLGVATFSGLDGVKVRKQIIVTNLDAANSLRVLDANNNCIGVVFAASAWTVETSGQVKVYNPNGAGVDYNVGQIFYS